MVLDVLASVGSIALCIYLVAAFQSGDNVVVRLASGFVMMVVGLVSLQLAHDSDDQNELLELRAALAGITSRELPRDLPCSLESSEVEAPVVDWVDCSVNRSAQTQSFHEELLALDVRTVQAELASPGYGTTRRVQTGFSRRDTRDQSLGLGSALTIAGAFLFVDAAIRARRSRQAET